MYGCGKNNYGQQGSGNHLGVTTFTKRASNVAQILYSDTSTWYLSTYGQVLGCGYSQEYQNSSASGSATTDYFTDRGSVNAIKASCSGQTAWYINTSGDLYGCGNNRQGQQGKGEQGWQTNVSTFTNRASNVNSVVASSDATWYITTSGDLYGCGQNTRGKQGMNDNDSYAYVTSFTKRASNVSQVISSQYATWYITTSGDLYGCGLNNYGQQGSGATSNVLTFTKRASNVAQVVCLNDATWYITTSGDLYGCGENVSGQQGNSSTSNVLTFENKMNYLQG